MFGRGVDVCAHASDLAARVVHRHLRHAEVRYLYDLLVGRKQKVIRFDVAVNDSLAVRVSERLGHLLKIKERIVEAERLAAAQIEQITARHVFQHQIMKARAREVCRCAMPQAANDVRVSHLVERNGFVLKILYKRLLKVRVGRALQGDVEGFDDYRLVRMQLVVSKENLRVAAATQAAIYEVAIIKYAVFQLDRKSVV